MSRHPLVKWAQRSDKLFITVELPDAKNVKLNLQPEGKFQFSATSGAENIPYEIDIELHDKVDVNESKSSVTSRNICYLVKKAESKWWSRLLKHEGKTPVFIKVDWDKWADEDDEKPGANTDFGGDFDFSKLGMGGDDFESGNDEDESDTDEEDEEATTNDDGSKENKEETNAGSKENKEETSTPAIDKQPEAAAPASVEQVANA